MPGKGSSPPRLDPQLDANALIRLLSGMPEVVAYANANRADGLTYNLATRAEFLAKGGGGAAIQLSQLEQQHGIQLIQDVSLVEIDAVAARLQAAFQGDPFSRILRTADARVAATAFLKGERLATGDEQFFKRAKDLGLQVEFVGVGRVVARAAAYIPRPVKIPPP